MHTYLFGFFIAYILITMVCPMWRVYRRYGQKVFVLPNDDSAQGFIGKVLKSLTFAIFMMLIIRAFIPGWRPFLLPIHYFELESLLWAGLVFLHLSLVLIVIAQHQMNKSWRVGFDESQNTELVTKGLFRYSRNPVFLGMLTTMLGLFLALPNAVTLVVLCLYFVVIQIQVRLEEEYLSKAHGEAYRNYQPGTRRWL